MTPMTDCSNYKLSVSMCVYGGDDAVFFDEALSSIFNQTRKPDEVILVIDGPIPNEIDLVIKKYESIYDYFKPYYLAENQGHGNARRYGLSKCTYDYVAIADSDDINALNRFEKQMNYFETDRELSAISSGCYHFVDSIENVINEELFPTTDEDIKHFMRSRCPLCQASTIFRKADVLQAGGYLDWYHAEDYYLWVRMYLSGAKFANTPESLLYVRSNQEQMQRRGGVKYFRSLRKLYQYMYKNKIISKGEYLFNVSSRFVVQVIMPPKIRAFVRKKLL